MMAKEPGRRFQTPGEVAQALTPFFRKGSVAPVRSTSEISQAGQPEVGKATAGAGAVPAQSRERTQLRSIPERLIDLGEQNPSFDTMLDGTASKAAPETLTQGRHAWSMSAANLGRLVPRGVWAAAGMLLVGLLVALTVIRVRTPNGVIVLENVPENAVVEIDGRQITVTPSAGQPVKIEAQPGKRGVMVRRGDDLLLGKIVSLESGKEFKLTIRLESPVEPEPKEKSPPAEGPARESDKGVTDVPAVPPANPRRSSES